MRRPEADRMLQDRTSPTSGPAEFYAALWLPETAWVAAGQGLVGGRDVMRQSGRTFSAWGPFCPWVVSNSTFWFSSSDL